MSDQTDTSEPNTSTTGVYVSCPECPHDERLEIARDALVVDVTCSACGHGFLATYESEKR